MLGSLNCAERRERLLKTKELKETNSIFKSDPLSKETFSSRRRVRLIQQAWKKVFKIIGLLPIMKKGGGFFF